MTYHSFENVIMVLAHLVTSSYMLQALLLFGSVECNSNEIQMIHPSRDCGAEFDDCQSEGNSAGLVCGTDGQSYHSACHLFYQLCINGKNNQIGYIGDCQYQHADNEDVRRKQRPTDDTSSSSSSEENGGDGGQAGSEGGDEEDNPGEDENDKNDPDDESDEDIATPKPLPPPTNPPPTLPSKPVPTYCVDKPDPQRCGVKCGVQTPKFNIKLPDCIAARKCSSDTGPPRIPGTAAPPVQSSLPMVARLAVGFFSVSIASMLAVAGFRLYSFRTINLTRNRLPSDESRNLLIEMTSQISGRSGSATTYTSVA